MNNCTIYFTIFAAWCCCNRCGDCV